MVMMADPVAIISVVSGATVAIVVPFINAQLQRTRFVQESRNARREELGGLLDAAVQHLWSAWNVLYDIEQEAQKSLPGPDWSPERLRKLGQALTEHTIVIAEDGWRIELRTPQGARISQAHGEARNVVLGYESTYCSGYLDSGLIDQELPPRPPTLEASNAMNNFIEEIRTFVGVVDAA